MTLARGRLLRGHQWKNDSFGYAPFKRLRRRGSVWKDCRTAGGVGWDGGTGQNSICWSGWLSPIRRTRHPVSPFKWLLLPGLVGFLLSLAHKKGSSCRFKIKKDKKKNSFFLSCVLTVSNLIGLIEDLLSKQLTMMVFLHKGSWRTFQLVLLRERCVKHWDPHLSRKILMILQREELRERYLSGFPSLRPSEKLDLALDDIIDPLETLEDLGRPVPGDRLGNWRQMRMANYHPGRLTLNPDAYHHAYTESMGIGKDHICKALELGWVNLDWGRFCEGYICPPREGEPPPGKHRLLDRPEHRTSDPSNVWVDMPWAGLQDTYFLGGLPLIFWSRKHGDTMGMRVSTEEFCQPENQRNGVYIGDKSDFQRGRVAGFQWRSSEQLENYERMWYLPTETEYRCVSHIEPEEQVRIPRTFRSGSRPWIDRQAGENHGSNDAYINHIQHIEDIERAHGSADRRICDSTTVEEFLEEREGLQLKTLGGW